MQWWGRVNSHTLCTNRFDKMHQKPLIYAQPLTLQSHVWESVLRKSQIRTDMALKVFVALFFMLLN